ncbi:unnamed protein product [Cuscuta epithymum]|uniref:Uncharacterized protein n=1 Tax=Cuscuta epithymum TaxID=186058 RepID=A0AAV0FQX9_9ASTE|nr:unnamed protein product [Cuscuta epithymum]
MVYIVSINYIVFTCNQMQPRKRNREPESNQSVGVHDRGEEPKDEGVATQGDLVHDSNLVDESNLLDESNIVDIAMMCVEEATFGSEVPILEGIELETHCFYPRL